MKQVSTVLTVILLIILVGCGRSKQSNDDLIIVDVSKGYLKKELTLQDFMSVEYVALETTDEFLTQGLVQDMGKEYLLITSRDNDGNIFTFDRQTGKGLKKINRREQGTEEYARINEIILDESNDEIFVKSPENKILVYDLNGGFKRCLNLGRSISSIFDYDEHNLFCYDVSNYYSKGKDRDKLYHILISRQNENITREIFILFRTISTPIVTGGDRFITNYSYQICLSSGKWTLTDASAGILYNYAPDGTLNPFIVRIPSANTMESGIFLYMGIHTDRYYFMEVAKNVFNFGKGNGFYTDGLVCDKKGKTIFQVVVYNDDYAEKRTVAMTAKSINHDIGDVTNLSASQLIEICRKEQLKDGKLKEITSRLNEEDNPVIMLVKQRSSGLK